MKILSKDLRQGFVKIQVDSVDDLWYLSHVISVTDSVSGSSFRKIRIGEEPNVKIVRKPVFVRIRVEKVDFSPESDSLRVLGTVEEGPEDVPRGEHHSFGFELNDSFTIFKRSWPGYLVERLEEAAKPKSVVLILVLDRDSSTFALLKGSGYDVLSSVSGEVAKKDVDQKVKGDFFESVAKQLGEYVERYNPGSIVVGSPGFWKMEFSKVLPESLASKIVFATISSSGESGVVEVLKREEVKTALKNDRTTREISAVDKLLAEINRSGNVVYGFDETKNAAESGAVDTLLITEVFLRDSKDSNRYDVVDSLMRLVEQSKGKVVVISSDHEGGKKLDGLGGIAALLRYKVSF